ncbi:hypothetical protein L917_07361, partial [Phytophthora nicotianae]
AAAKLYKVGDSAGNFLEYFLLERYAMPPSLFARCWKHTGL